jgi:hypothetical protein
MLYFHAFEHAIERFTIKHLFNLAVIHLKDTVLHQPIGIDEKLFEIRCGVRGDR